jgi:hypothetical protein
VSETEKREEEYQEIACGFSNNELAWTTLSITTFVLIATIFTAFNVDTNDIFLRMTIILSLLGAILFATCSTLLQSAALPHRLLFKDKKTGKPVANPRQRLVKRAEQIHLTAIMIHSGELCSFLMFLKMYWALAIIVPSLALCISYGFPRWYLWRERT